MTTQSKTMHGFSVIRAEQVASLDALVTHYRHDKTGAEVLHVKNKDPECFYSVGFKTPPTDHTGLPHIFEHVTMMGSKNYPVRDVFVGLLRKAHTSFLNAMTYPDKTVYPVASTNKKEFKKLFEVYTDLAFSPTVYDHPEVFMQEGVRFDVDAEGELSLNGVVLNEMKGRLASAEAQLGRYGMAALFPDTQYSFNSGGDPDAIPSLTYDELLVFHKKHYHPSNAHFTIYGDVPVSSYLKHLDDNYFSHYKKIRPPKVSLQKPKALRDVKRSFTSAGKTEYSSYSFLLEDNKNVQSHFEWQILVEILMGDNDAPLKRALLDSKLAKDYSCDVETEMAQLFMMIFAKNLKPGTTKEFKKVVRGVFRRLVQDGIPHELIERAVAQYELRLKNISGSTGMGLKVMDLAESGWLYGCDPIAFLKLSETFSERKHLLTPLFFEKKIQKYLIENDHAHTFTLVPTKKDIQKEKLDAVIAKKKKTLGQKGIEKLRETQEAFRTWQTTDTVDFDTVYPTLPIDAVSEQPLYTLDWKKKKTAGVDHYVSKGLGNGLAHTTIALDISHIRAELLPAVSLYLECFTDVKNDMYIKDELKMLIDTKTMGIHTEVTDVEHKGSYRRLLMVSATHDEGATQEVWKAICAALVSAEITKKKLTEVLQSEISSLESSASYFSSSMGLVSKRLRAKLEKEAVSSELTTGLSYLLSLKYKNATELFNSMSHVQGNIKDALLHAVFTNATAKVDVSLYFSGKSHKRSYVPKTIPNRKEAFLIDSSSHSHGVGSRLDIAGSVLQKATHTLVPSFVNPTYLWRALRDNGGAYGGRITPSKPESLVIQSWSDPRIEGTFKDIKGISKYIEKQEITSDELLKSKIVAFSKLDAPQSSHELFHREMKRVLRGKSHSEDVSLRKKIINISPKAFKKTALELFSSQKKKSYMTIGGEKTIKASSVKYDDHIDIRSK